MECRPHLCPRRPFSPSKSRFFRPSIEHLSARAFICHVSSARVLVFLEKAGEGGQRGSNSCTRRDGPMIERRLSSKWMHRALYWVHDRFCGRRPRVGLSSVVIFWAIAYGCRPAATERIRCLSDDLTARTTQDTAPSLRVADVCCGQKLPHGRR